MPIHVAAAAILDNLGRVLISKRADHLHQGGLWEFPGGKVEAGETLRQALARELKEELDILPLEFKPLIRIKHDYGDRQVLLDFFRVTRFEGDAKGMEGQPLRWLQPKEMLANLFPAADRPVITALQLPDRYLITGCEPTQPEDFLRRLDLALKNGLRLVQLRAHALDDAAYKHLLNAASPLCERYNAKLLVNRPSGCVRWLGMADGIHLTANQMMALAARPSGKGLIGASCHNREELEQTSRLRLDYVFLSPVAPTATHPNTATLGWEKFSDWVENVNLPVYALGGMHPNMLGQASQAGAQGIAAIRSLWPEG
ncbi:MAG: Nudix family hydrolase [Candidatus Thiodiazotropha sp. (ex Gloverina cf. vestifex)]|nr:Nudix family hydrolase [Candidatus Thiodiazotropha sp. (ex Gloverina cf. vestifex)]